MTFGMSLLLLQPWLTGGQDAQVASFRFQAGSPALIESRIGCQKHIRSKSHGNSGSATFGIGYFGAIKLLASTTCDLSLERTVDVLEEEWRRGEPRYTDRLGGLSTDCGQLRADEGR
jgi:hypothetical protein